MTWYLAERHRDGGREIEGGGRDGGMEGEREIEGGGRDGGMEGEREMEGRGMEGRRMKGAIYRERVEGL